MFTNAVCAVACSMMLYGMAVAEDFQNYDAVSLEDAILASENGLVLYYGSEIVGIETEVRALNGNRYRAIALTGSDVPADRIFVLLDYNGPVELTQEQLYGGELSGTVERSYNEYFGKPVK